jgi:hypothetical protein
LRLTGCYILLLTALVIGGIIATLLVVGSAIGAI